MQEQVREPLQGVIEEMGLTDLHQMIVNAE